MLVSIIIVNYNTFQVTCNCIDTVLQHTKGVPYEIVLVDNCSTRDNPQDFADRFGDRIRLVVSPENGGFAKGNNLGIEHAKGDILLLLNSDTLLTEDSISISAQYLTRHQEKMLTVKLVYENGIYQNNARRFRNIKTEVLDIFRPLMKLLPYRKRAGIMLNQYFKGDFDIRCDWVIGAYMMFPAATLQLMPEKKLDERYFMYCEDQLWCYQVAPRGNGCIFLSGTTVVHIGNASVDVNKQLGLYKKYIPLELDLMRYRKGRGLYYYTFKWIFTGKELVRYYLKLIAFRLLGKKIY